MNRLFFAFVIFATSFAHARYQNCDAEQEGALRAAAELVPSMIQKLRTEIQLELDPKTARDKYDPGTLGKLKKADSKLECLSKKIPKLKFECTNEYNRYSARTLPLVGKEVKLSNHFFDHDSNDQVAMIIHEASHKCATNDAFYFHRIKSLNNVADKNYHNTADTYETWAESGFCVPGYSCR